jgi:hypothetical protein
MSQMPKDVGVASPWPWKIRHAGHMLRYDIEDANGWTIATLAGWMNGPTGRDGVLPANARLMVAAPALLNALVRVSVVLAEAHAEDKAAQHYGPEPCSLCAALAEAQEVIAAATGKPFLEAAPVLPATPAAGEPATFKRSEITCGGCGSREGFRIWTKDLMVNTWSPDDDWGSSDHGDQFEPVEGFCLACDWQMPQDLLEAIVWNHISEEVKQ